jgi:hypothetical protein
VIALRWWIWSIAAAAPVIVVVFAIGSVNRSGYEPLTLADRKREPSGDDPRLASYLRIEERELGAGGLNELLDSCPGVPSLV